MPALFLLTGLLPAFAGPAQDIAAEFGTLGAPPKVAVACSPIREALSVAEAMGTLSDGPTRPELEALLRAASDPSAEAAQGVDLDGGFLALDANGTSIARLPIKGGLNDAIALFSKPDAPEWSLDGERAVRIEDDGKRSILTVHDGTARIRTGPVADSKATQSIQLPDSLDALPDGDGCALWLYGGDDPDAPAFLRNPITLWMPFSDDAPAELRVQLPPHRDRATRPDITPPLAVSSPARPTAVFTLGVPPARILNDPAVQKALPEAVRGQLDFGDALDGVGAGTVGAVFSGPAGPVFVVAVPVTTKRGRPVSRRRIQAEVDSSLGAGTFSKIAARAVIIDRYTTDLELPNGMTFTMRAERGRLYLGNARDFVLGAADGLGDPWLDEAGMDWAASHAVTLKGEGPLPGLTQPLVVQLGAGTEGDVLLVQLKLDPSIRDPRVAAAFRAMTEARKKRKNRPL